MRRGIYRKGFQIEYGFTRELYYGAWVLPTIYVHFRNPRSFLIEILWIRHKIYLDFVKWKPKTITIAQKEQKNDSYTEISKEYTPNTYSFTIKNTNPTSQVLVLGRLHKKEDIEKLIEKACQEERYEDAARYKKMIDDRDQMP